MKKQKEKSLNTIVKDYTVMQVMIAIVLFVISLYCLRLAEPLPLSVRAYEAMQNATLIGLIVYGVVAVASVVMLALNFNRAIFRISKHTLAISILGLITCLIFRKTFTGRISFLYFLHAAFYGLYIIYMLYKTEFFLVSLMTSVFGWSILAFYPELSFSLRTVLYLSAILLVCCGSVVIAWKASGSKGYLKLFGKKKKLFPASFQPTGIILTAALWILCLIACMIVGSFMKISMLPYYCMFAAVAYELIAAVYYTFRLQ